MPLGYTTVDICELWIKFSAHSCAVVGALLAEQLVAGIRGHPSFRFTHQQHSRAFWFVVGPMGQWR